MNQITDIAIVPAYRSVYETGIDEKHLDHSNEPYIEMDVLNQTFLVKGRSYPIHPRIFFADVFLWLEIYSLSPLKAQELRVSLSGFNAASALHLLKIFEMWLSIEKDNTVVWEFSTVRDEMYDAGIEFRDMIGERFKLVRKAQ